MTQRHCPNDGSPMHTIAQDGVEVEKCPRCSGLFFDANEFEAAIAYITTKRNFRPRSVHDVRESQRARTSHDHHSRGHRPYHGSNDGFFGSDGIFDSSGWFGS